MMSNPRAEAFKKMKAMFEQGQMWIGIDWASDSGMLRGDVIKREGNVTHLRFKTWEIGDA